MKAMYRKKTGFGVLVLLAAALFISSSALAAVNIRLAHGEPEDQTYGVYASMLAANVEKMSNGSMKCTVYANGVMGSELELGQKVQQGTLNMALVTSTNAGSLAPSVNVLMLPYLFGSPEALMGDAGHLRSGSPFRERLAQRIASEAGTLRLLGVGTNGFRLLFTKTAPVTSIAGLKGLKLRLPASPVLQRTWETWGAAAYPIAWSETFTAIQQGVADAYESPLDTLLKSGFYPYTKFVTENLYYAPLSFLVLTNDRWLKKLTPEQQAVLTKAADATDKEHFAWVQAQHGKVKEELLAKGVTFHQLTDADVWKARSVVLWPEFAKIAGGEEWVNSVMRFMQTGSFN